VLLLIDNYASSTEQGMFPAPLEVTAWTGHAYGARVGEGR
jgi:hypothetical protein